jgi:hypothetical protein
VIVFMTIASVTLSVDRRLVAGERCARVWTNPELTGSLDTDTIGVSLLLYRTRFPGP